MAPRCFIVRHGETEWSLSGRHTGITDLALTANGEKRVRATGKALVGDDRLIVPRKLAHIYVSPRRRAQDTLKLLGLGGDGVGTALDSHEQRTLEQEKGEPKRMVAQVEVTEAVREWDYGNYEGMTSKEINAAREREGKKEKWDIWRHGCPGGESPEDITRRVDAVIHDIRTKFHSKRFGPGEDEQGDVLVVAHGHFLRAFAMRWTGKSLEETSLILEAGGVGTLSYEHNNINEPAIILGGGFVVD